MELELFIKKRLAENTKRLDFVQRELEACCEGKLSEEKRGDKVHFVQTIYAQGVRRRRGITNNTVKIESLIRRRIFGKEQASLKSEQDILMKLRDSLVGFDLFAEIEELKKSCPDLEEQVIFNALYLNANKKWQEEPYEQSDYLPEMRRHITSRGLKVRSKSELLIAEKLYAYDVPFRYEQVIHFNSISIVPDFTIRLKDGQIILWEHMGLMNNENYKAHQKKKVEMYEKLGYVPWENLILTYDNADGIIDLRIVEAEIKNKLTV